LKNFTKIFFCLFAATHSKPTYQATPITQKESKLEYLPIPSNNSSNKIVSYKPSAIVKKKDDSNESKAEEKSSVSSTIVSESTSTDVNNKDKSGEKKSSSSSHSKSHKSSSHKRDSHSSSSSSSHKHKHKSSSSSSSSSRHRSSSDSSRRSSSKHKSDHKHKHRDKDRERDKSDSDKDRKKESSSKKRKHSSNEDDSNSESKEKKSIDQVNDSVQSMELDNNDEDDYDDFAEDEIESQCRMIFESYKVPTETTDNNTQNNGKASSQQDNQSEDILYEGKKRHAHENASKIFKAPTVVKQNHTLAALMTNVKRHDEAIQKAIEQKELAQKEIAALQADIKEKEENFTPLVNPLIFVRPPPKRPAIAPISQRMAIEAAKRRVMELNKSMQQKSFTAAQTSSKSSGRVAHVPTNISDVDASKLAPPVLEANQTKISCNIRTQFYKMMVKHCLEIYSLPADAFERAQNEELQVMKKCSVVSIYKTSAMLAINRLKKEAETNSSKKSTPKMLSHDVVLAGAAGARVSWSVNNKHKIGNSESSLLTIDNCSSSQAYNLILECILNEQQLQENGYPRSSLTRGSAQFYVPKRVKPQNGCDDDFYCARCHKVFNTSIYDEKHADLCNYHAKRSGFRRGHSDNFYYCCQAPAGSTGCCYADYHVLDYIDYDNLAGFVTTMDKHDDDYVCTKNDIFALDCEMCYTVQGLELTRITIVNFNEKVVYDKFIRPQNRVIDYNTRYSGITKETLETPDALSLPEIQAVLLSMFHSKTILIGHSLESDLKALKMIHSYVVDTSVLYPHKMGPPKKRALKTLCIEHLKKIIQEDGEIFI
jgi:RNA exonuclease 1